MPDEDRVRLTRFAPVGRSAGGMSGYAVLAVLNCSEPTTAPDLKERSAAQEHFINL